MQCCLCNKTALRIVGKKGFCGAPMDVDGHYREAEQAAKGKNKIEESILAANRKTLPGKARTKVHLDNHFYGGYNKFPSASSYDAS